jgi:hypothetical protein
MDNLRTNREFFNIEQTIAHLPHRKKPWSGAVCVGTGPSLEKNFGALAHRPPDILVIACETAIRYLSDKGIVPDIVVTGEEQIVVARAFKGLQGWYPSVALVASTTASSFGLHIAQKAGADIFFYNSAHPMLINDGRYQHGNLPKKCPSLTPMCGSILYHAVALADWLGIHDIALAGADFGYAVIRDANRNQFIRTHVGGYRVEGIPPEAINQAFDYHMAELDFRKQKRLRIVNCTEGGRLELYPKENLSGWIGRISPVRAEASTA